MQSNKSTNPKYFHRYFGYNLAYVTFIYCMSAYNDYIDMDWKSFDYCYCKNYHCLPKFWKNVCTLSKARKQKVFMLYIFNKINNVYFDKIHSIPLLKI